MAPRARSPRAPRTAARSGTPAAPARKVRRSQAERSAETQARLLDATEAALVELGIYGASTPEICRRSGVSHGSLLHHFGTRDRLFAAALARLYERRREEVLRAAHEAERSRDRLRVLVERMAAVFSADDFKVILELWLAAANDAALRRRVFPVMQAFDAGIRPLAARLFPAAARRPRSFHAAVGILFNFMQGMGLARAAWRGETLSPADEAAERELLVKLLGPVLDA